MYSRSPRIGSSRGDRAPGDRRETRVARTIVRAVAAWLDIAASRIRVVRGGSGRHKLLAIEGVDDAALRERIALIDAPGG